MEHHDSKLQLEQELTDYIESKKLKKNILEDHSTCILNSIRDEDSKLHSITNKAKTNMRIKKKRAKKNKELDLQSKSQTKTKKKLLHHDMKVGSNATLTM